MFGSMNVLGCFLYVFGFSRTMLFLVCNVFFCLCMLLRVFAI